MRILAVLLTIHIHAAYAITCTYPTDSWYACKQDSECVQGPAGCGRAAFNVAFLKEAEKYSDCVAPVMECAINPNNQVDELAKCINSRCTLVKKIKTK